MAGHRLDRISEDIKRELCDIMRSVKDPRVSGFLSIVHVDVTNDLSYATVYVSAMEGIEVAKESVKGLKSAAGYVRRELGSRLKLRHVPEIRFVADDSISKSAQINETLKNIMGSGTDEAK